VPPRLRLIVVARLDDAKLRSKLAPIVALEEVDELVLVRRTPLVLDGVTNRCPPGWTASVATLAEAWRLWTILRLCARRPRPSYVIALYMIPHGLYAELARRLFRVPTVQVSLSQLDLDLSLRRPLLRQALRAAHFVGVRGAHSRRRLVEAGLDPARVFEPPNVHDVEPYAAADGTAKDVDVLFVGGLVPCKRVDVLLRAVAQVRRTHPELRAVVVGGGEGRGALERLASALGLGANVTFAGEETPDAVARWLGRSRLFILTSEVEGLPMAMVEALSCGVPVIVPDVGDVTTVARDGENAWVVRDPAPERYAEALATLLDDEPRRRRLAEGARASRERFRKDYSLGAGIAAWRTALSGAAQPRAGDAA
jgi:glycosyltransferase involved in cell wall biosynthesis